MAEMPKVPVSNKWTFENLMNIRREDSQHIFQNADRNVDAFKENSESCDG